MQCKQMLSTHTQRGKIGCQNVAQITQIQAAAVRSGHISVLPDLLIFRGFLIFAGFLFFVGFLPALANLEGGVAGGQQCNILGSSSALKFLYPTEIQYSAVPFKGP